MTLDSMHHTASGSTAVSSGGKGAASSARQTCRRSAALDEAVHHLLLPRLVEIDSELVAVDLGDAAIAEFLMEHAHADRESGALHRARRDERAVYGNRLARPR